MKRMTLLGFLILLFVPNEAKALSIIDVSYTGFIAEKFDFGGYLGGTDGGYMGGPAANNSLGSAYQFVIDRPVDIDYISMNGHAWDTDPSASEQLDFNFKLYSETTYKDLIPIPNTESLIMQSPVHVTDNVNQDRIYTNEQVAFDVSLVPGTYWIAREREYGQSGLIMDEMSTRFISSDRAATLVNPEPSTLALFGFGLLPMLLRKIRKSKLT